MDDLVAAGVAGIMVSAVDPKHQTEGLNKIGGQTVLFTTDSDAPQTKRIAYIGTSNTDAGKQAGSDAEGPARMAANASASSGCSAPTMPASASRASRRPSPAPRSS